MKIKSILFGSIVSVFIFSGCTYKNATIDYRKYNAYSQNLGGNVKYKEIAPITATSSSFFWTDCSEITTNVLRELQSKAKALGGNGVIDVKWSTDNGWSLTPTCETQWGWAVAYIIPVFGPWVQRAHAEGVAVKFINNNK